MDIASKIRVVNTGPMAYTAPVTRKEFKDIILECADEIDVVNKNVEGLVNKLEGCDNYVKILNDRILNLEHSNKSLAFKLDIVQKALIDLEVRSAKPESKGLFNYIKNLF